MYSLVEVLVYNLSLAVSLGVEGSKALNLNPKDTAEFVLEIGYELMYFTSELTTQVS